MLTSEELKAIRGRWIDKQCECDHAYAERCIDCADTDIPALLDTVEDLRGLASKAVEWMQQSESPAMWNCASKLEEALQ